MPRGEIVEQPAGQALFVVVPGSPGIAGPCLGSGQQLQGGLATRGDRPSEPGQGHPQPHLFECLGRPGPLVASGFVVALVVEMEGQSAGTLDRVSVVEADDPGADGQGLAEEWPGPGVVALGSRRLGDCK